MRDGKEVKENEEDDEDEEEEAAFECCRAQKLGRDYIIFSANKSEINAFFSLNYEASFHHMHDKRREYSYSDHVKAHRSFQNGGKPRQAVCGL